MKTVTEKYDIFSAAVNMKNKDKIIQKTVQELEVESDIIVEQEKKKITFQTIIENISGFFKRAGISDMFILRFAGAFFLISGINISIIKKSEITAINKWQEFVGEVNFTRTLILMIAVFAVLTVIHWFIPEKLRITDQSFAIVSILYFDIMLLWKNSDSYVAIGVMLVSLVFIYNALTKMRKTKYIYKIPWWICGIIILLFAVMVTVFVSVTSICHHKNFGTSTHDLGLFVQMYHNLSTNLTAVTTCERDEFLSHFYIHASYIYYLLVPVYKLFPKAETLLIAQAILAMGGIIPTFLIAKKHNMKGLSLIFIGIAYVFCSSLISPCYYDFHENCFLPTLLMWLLWAVDSKKYILFYVFSILVCIVKEDAPLYVICIGIYMLFEDKNKGRINGLIMAVISGIYMMIITSWLTNNGDGQMMTSARFGMLLIDSEGGLKEVVKNTLADPGYFFNLIIKENTVKFFLQVMLPMLFLPFFTKKLYRYMLMMPFIITNLVIGSSYGYAANIDYQYIFGPVCLLFYMCIINLGDMGQIHKRELPVIMGCASLIMAIGTQSNRINYYENYMLNKEYNIQIEEILESIPDDASVLCDTWLVPHIANRSEVYLLDNNDYNAEENTIVNLEKYDFFVISTYSEVYSNMQPLFEELGITLYASANNHIEIYKSSQYDLGN